MLARLVSCAQLNGPNASGAAFFVPPSLGGLLALPFVDVQFTISAESLRPATPGLEEEGGGEEEGDAPEIEYEVASPVVSLSLRTGPEELSVDGIWPPLYLAVSIRLSALTSKTALCDDGPLERCLAALNATQARHASPLPHVT